MVLTLIPAKWADKQKKNGHHLQKVLTYQQSELTRRKKNGHHLQKVLTYQQSELTSKKKMVIT